MSQREINEMLGNSLRNLNLLVDSSKVLGSPMHIDDNKVLIPLSKITFGFGVGGSELITEKGKVVVNNLLEDDGNYPFGGGTLGGVNISPIAFLLIDGNDSKVIRVEKEDTLFEKFLDLFISLSKKKQQKNKD